MKHQKKRFTTIYNQINRKIPDLRNTSILNEKKELFYNQKL